MCKSSGVYIIVPTIKDCNGNNNSDNNGNGIIEENNYVVVVRSTTALITIINTRVLFMYSALVHDNHLNKMMLKYIWTTPLHSNEYNAPIVFNVEYVHITGMEMQLIIIIVIIIKFQLIIRKFNICYNIVFYILIIVFVYNYYINVLYCLNKYTSELHFCSDDGPKNCNKNVELLTLNVNQGLCKL
jgi:hypothetical protein